ncbi:MAG: hypothetical protein NTY19_48655 [Planctomycetota bacterium]|nr:hypothetical protein [Planctomycetota bacterium]
MSEVSNEQILQQAAIWSHNRRLYPGWLIAPNEIRRTSWDFTRHWIGHVVSASSRLEAEQSLWLLYELNWRLETSLLPMFDVIAVAVERVLLNWCRGPDEASTAERVELPIEFPEGAVARPRPDIRTMWKELAFAVLRYHREERHHEAFSRWLDRAARPEPLSDDERCRLCYERALHALGDLDDGQALKSLTDWPNNCRDPIWVVRKAALHVELGDLATAESLAIEALSNLRRNTMQQAADIPNLSREGWTMSLLFNVAWARHLESQSRPVPERPTGRWAQLSKFQCDPRTEPAWFESRLDQPAPVTPPSVTQKASFEPGEYRRTYHGSDQGLWDQLSVAYQLMRLSEEAPYPPTIGDVSFSGTSLRRAAEWFIEHDPVRTRTLVLRLRNKDLTDHYFSRHRIAALPCTGVAELRELAERSLSDSSAKLTGSESRSDTIAERKRRRLFASIDVLARTIIRAPIEEVLRLWNTALQLYESPVVRMDSYSAEALFRLFHSLIDSLPDGELGPRFRQVIELPIPETKSFRVLNSLQWPELTDYFEKRLPSLSDPVVDETWASVTDRLLQAARDENPGVRSRVIRRLAALFRYGCLDETASKRLAEVYWLRINHHGLPDVQDLHRWVCLSLPEPEPGVSEERFRRYFATTPFKSDMAIDWICATGPAHEQPSQGRRFVDWTSDEIRSMVAKMKDWWDHLDIAAETQRERGHAGVWWRALGQTSYREGASEMLDVLRLVVIPRIQDDAETIEVVSNLVQDFAKHGLPVAAVLPAMQAIQPGRDVAPEMRRALASHEPDVYSSALRGLVHWMEILHAGRSSSAAMSLPEPPRDLLRELGMIIATRRQPGLLQALDAVAWVLQDCPDTIDDGHLLDSIVVALEYLWGETKYRSFGSESDRIPYSEVPVCREKAARIAALLQKTRAAEAETVQQWIAAASDDPLPEVRRAVVDVAAVALASGQATSIDELLRLIDASIADWISSGEEGALVASLPPLLEQAAFASSLGVVSPKERLQLAALMVVSISQTLMSARTAQFAIKAIVSDLITSPRHLSQAESRKLFDVAVRDERAQPVRTLTWLRKWMSETEDRKRKRKRSDEGKPPRQQRRRSS